MRHFPFLLKSRAGHEVSQVWPPFQSPAEEQSTTGARTWAHTSAYTKALLLLFMLTLPLVNPWVRGDGVGYYAYIHALLIHHNLNFENEWRGANQSFIEFKLDADGKIKPMFYTRTGHLENHFSVGPSMLWAPFLAPVHLAMLT